MLTSLSRLYSDTIQAQKILQESIRGGVATDGTEVATPRAGGSTPAAAPPDTPSLFTPAWRPIELRMPATARIKQAFLAIHGGFQGNPADPAPFVTFAGKSMSEAGPPVFSNTIVSVYDVTNGYGVSPETQFYAVEERGDADPFYTNGGLRNGGEQLVVLFEDGSTGAPLRQVSWFIHDAFGSAAGTVTSFPGLVACGSGSRTITASFGIVWETQGEQNSKVFIQNGADPEPPLSSVLGGCDDGQPATARVGNHVPQHPQCAHR